MILTYNPQIFESKGAFIIRTLNAQAVHISTTFLCQ